MTSVRPSEQCCDDDDCTEPALVRGYCRMHAALELECERDILRAGQTKVRAAEEAIAELEQGLGIAPQPAPLSPVAYTVIPIDQAAAFFAGNDEALAFVTERLAKGDPGPLHVRDGVMWTTASDVERGWTTIISLRTDEEDDGWRVQLEATGEKAAATHFGALSREEGIAVALVLLARVIIDRAQTASAQLLDEELERALERHDEATEPADGALTEAAG